MEQKMKHLEFIQNVITRMNSNSFLIKGWAITLVSALFALAANGSNINYVLISYIVILVFWVLSTICGRRDVHEILRHAIFERYGLFVKGLRGREW